MLQALVHYSLHFILPVVIAWIFFRGNWKKAALILLATMIIDVDHLMADPIFSSDRCSINFHPFHSNIAIAAYAILLIIKKTRVIAIGLLLHIFTDLIDCIFMNNNYFT